MCHVPHRSDCHTRYKFTENVASGCFPASDRRMRYHRCSGASSNGKLYYHHSFYDFVQLPTPPQAPAVQEELRDNRAPSATKSRNIDTVISRAEGSVNPIRSDNPFPSQEPYNAKLALDHGSAAPVGVGVAFCPTEPIRAAKRVVITEDDLDAALLQLESDSMDDGSFGSDSGNSVPRCQWARREDLDDSFSRMSQRKKKYVGCSW